MNHFVELLLALGDLDFSSSFNELVLPEVISYICFIGALSGRTRGGGTELFLRIMAIAIGHGAWNFDCKAL